MGSKKAEGQGEVEEEEIRFISQSFLSTWSAHGFSHLVKTGKFSSKVWLLIVLASIAVIIYLIVTIVTKAIHPPVATKITSLRERALPLPAISFCNFNIYNKTAAFANGSLVGEWLAQVTFNMGNGYSFDAYMRSMDQDPDYWRARLPSFTTEADGRNVTEEVLKVAHTKEGSILSAANAATDESLMENITVINTDMGVCFSYQAPDHVIHRAGQEEGIVLLLDVHADEYTINDQSTEEGFKVFIHDKSETPNLRNQGVMVSESQSSFIGITKQQRLSYNTDEGCIDTVNAENPLAYYSDYSRENCYSECERNHTVGICGCRLIHHRGGEETCDSWRKMSNCSDEKTLFQSNEEVLERCAVFCKSACETVEYETSTTTGKYPSALIKKLAKFEHGEDYASKWARMSKVHVYFASMEVTTIEYITTYGLKELWGDLGGCLGLCLGASIISILELIEYGIQATMLMISQGK